MFSISEAYLKVCLIRMLNFLPLYTLDLQILPRAVYFCIDVKNSVLSVQRPSFVQGVVTKDSFAGGPASHGASCHRSMGSTGQRDAPGRVSSCVMSLFLYIYY